MSTLATCDRESPEKLVQDAKANTGMIRMYISLDDHMVRKSVVLSALLLLFVAAIAHSEDSGQKDFAITRGGTLTLMVPRSLGDDLNFSSSDGKSSLVFGPNAASQFLVNIYMIIPAGASGSNLLRMALRTQIEDDAAKYSASAVEPEVQIENFDGPNVSGYAFSLEDRAPKADEHKYLTEIVVQSGRLVITGYVLTNDGALDVANAAIEMLRNASYQED